SEGGVLEPVHLGLGKTDLASVVTRETQPDYMAPRENDDFPTLSEIEKRHILHALKRSKGNRTHAAKVLDISIRTLRNKLNEYNYRGLTESAEEAHVAA